MTKIFLLPVDEKINNNIFSQLLNFVSSKKRMKIMQFNFDIDKKLSLYSELLVRYLACMQLHISNDKIEFSYGKYGKPHILNFPNFHYNISHTHSTIVMSISENPVGVDIEKIRSVDRKIVNRFFTDGERAYVYDDEKLINERFYEIWTKKEAYIKYTGRGLSMPLDSFNVCNEPLSHIIQTYKMNGYVISCCSDSSNEESEIINIPEIFLVKQYVKIE